MDPFVQKCPNVCFNESHQAKAAPIAVYRIDFAMNLGMEFG